MSFESTASLGLSASIDVYSASIAEVINDTTSSYDFAVHTENSLKFITAKVYENTDKITKSYTENQRYFGRNVYVNPIKADLIGNSSTSTILETARTIGGVSFNGSANINLPGVNTAGNQNTTGTATKATSIQATANNTNNESTYITFVDGASGTQGIETDTGLRYNPSLNLIDSTITYANTASYSYGDKGTRTEWWVTPAEFHMQRSTAQFSSNGGFLNVTREQNAIATFTMPRPCILNKQLFMVNSITPTGICQLTYHSLYGPYINPVTLATGNVNGPLQIAAAKNFDPTKHYLAITVQGTDDGSCRLTSAVIKYVQK